LFWGLIVSMWIGNLMLVVLNLPLVGLWVKLLKVPYRVLFPAILLFCTIGVYSLNYNAFDIYVMGIFGIIGYIWTKLKCEGAPLLLGLVLGPMMEENFRRALLLSRGDFLTFVERPLSLTLLLMALGLVILVASPSIRKKREETFVEED
ncbi:MAG: tripartite tricarboxylate transporter permease, partial [Alcaligenaceae bacterium]|nr:tripartite tricarboxylate transporter permease [Alcaligenaceae bacterium]